MNIAFVGQKGIPAHGGGVENYVDNIATRLARRGHDVWAYTRDNYAPAQEDYKGVRTIATPGLHGKNVDAITHSFTAILHAFTLPKLDVIHINSVGPALLTPIAKLGFFVKGLVTGHQTKVVFTFHSADWHHGKWSPFAKTMLRLGARMGCVFADEVVTVSKSLRNVALKEFGCEATYIPNGTNIYRVTSDKELAKFGLERRGYIVFIARLVKHKNAHVLVKAFRHMKKRYGKKLVIVGGSANTDDYVAYLKDLVAGDPDIMMLGHQSGRTLKQLFANAACYVLPSSSEGLSISLLEAGSYGLPIVISSIRENREVVEDNGYVARTNSYKDLAAKLEDVFSDYRTALEKAEALQDEVKFHYSWKNIVRAFEKVYERDSFEHRGEPVRVTTQFVYE